MTSRLSLIIFAVVPVLNLVLADGGGHHHHVIIHVPYKIHTIHHTIMKHIHHHDKDGEDKYEVIGYTVGKPIDLGHHHFGHEQLPALHQQEHDFGGGNELGHGHDWAPNSYGQHDFAGGGHGVGNHLEGHADPGSSLEFARHAGFGGYD